MKNIDQFIDDFLFHCQYEKNLSSLTLKAYSIDLKQFCQFIWQNYRIEKIDAICKDVIKDYLKKLYEKNKPKTIKRKIASVKAFMGYLEFDDVIIVNPFRKIRLSIREGKQLPKTIEIKKIKKIFSYLYLLKQKNNFPGKYSYNSLIRDIAVIELLFASGMRVSELSNLKTYNINISKGFVKIKGKGNKERIIPIPHNETIEALQLYRDLFSEKIEKEGYFFINRLDQKLSDQSIRLMINKHTKKLNFDQHITPHMFRHSVATLLLENGVDIRYIQNILGHSTITTTQIYAQVNDSANRKILKLRHPRVKFSLK